MNKLKLLLYIFSGLTLSILVTAFTGKGVPDHYQDGYIKYDAVQLTDEEKETVIESLKSQHEKYDPAEKMLTKTMRGLSMATDAQSGTVLHEVLASFNYAIALLDVGDKQYTKRAFEVIKKTTLTQDQDPNSKSCGVFPYYMEEPLATKKSVIDFNWADFCAVRLLDIWMGHQNEIPDTLTPIIRNALLLAAQSIQKRDCAPSYTNIAIMGTYVTYMVSHLFNLEEMKDYSRNRLKRFYNYTLDKGGFSEYNSPTYSIVALDELYRMKSHIVEPSDKQMVDSLYSIDWKMIARHYHQPTGQWTGPNSRSYGTLTGSSFYGLLNSASNGKIFPDVKERRRDVKIKHQIPDYLLHYFLTPEYPRTETDVFDKEEPQILGTCYMTNKYAFSTANRSSLWTQRRPFLVFWGNVQTPKYLQVQFLHDNFDFSSAYFFSKQKENKALAAIEFFYNGGDKHISIDRLKEGKLVAKDLRLRFKFGNVKSPDELSLPASANEPFSITLDSLKFNIQLCFAEFENLKGHWEKGGDERASWIDFVFYAGPQTEFDLTKINRAAMSFTFSIGNPEKPKAAEKAKVSEKKGIMKVQWGGFELEVPVKPQAPDKIFI
jgi:hypothetical protein